MPFQLNLPKFSPVLGSVLAMAAAGGVHLLLAQAVELETQSQKIRVVTLAEGLDRPWSIAFLPDGGFLVTELPGNVRLIRNGVVQP